MHPGQRLVTRNMKYGAWKEGELGLFKGERNGQYVVDFHGRILKYKSEEWMLKEWMREPFDISTSLQNQLPSGPTKTKGGANSWKYGEEIIYFGPENQQLRADDIGTYEGVHNQMHMVRVKRTGFVASYHVLNEYIWRGISSVWKAYEAPYFKISYEDVNFSSSAPYWEKPLPKAPAPLEVGQRLKVKAGVTYFDHLESKLGSYGGLTDSEVGNEKGLPTIHLDGGGYAKYVNEEELWKEWDPSSEQNKTSVQKPQSLVKKLCVIKGGDRVRVLNLEEYLAVEPDPVRREQAQRFVGMAEGEVYFEEAEGGFFRMCTPLVNDQVDQVDIERCMDQCNCEPVIAHPFCKLSDGTKVFSSPTSFTIGRGNVKGFGYEYFPSCRMEMEALGISKVIQDRCEVYMKSHQAPTDRRSLDPFYEYPQQILVSPKTYKDILKKESKQFLTDMHYGDDKK